MVIVYITALYKKTLKLVLMGNKNLKSSNNYSLLICDGTYVVTQVVRYEKLYSVYASWTCQKHSDLCLGSQFKSSWFCDPGEHPPLNKGFWCIHLVREINTYPKTLLAKNPMKWKTNICLVYFYFYWTVCFMLLWYYC